LIFFLSKKQADDDYFAAPRKEELCHRSGVFDEYAWADRHINAFS
jgi:hypothetical protein